MEEYTETHTVAKSICCWFGLSRFCSSQKFQFYSKKTILNYIWFLTALDLPPSYESKIHADTYFVSFKHKPLQIFISNCPSKVCHDSHFPIISIFKIYHELYQIGLLISSLKTRWRRKTDLRKEILNKISSSSVQTLSPLLYGAMFTGHREGSFFSLRLCIYF